MIPKMRKENQPIDTPSIDNWKACLAFHAQHGIATVSPQDPPRWSCLLYTSDAADERSSVDLGGRRIIKKKKNIDIDSGRYIVIIKYDDDPWHCKISTDTSRHKNTHRNEV